MEEDTEEKRRLSLWLLSGGAEANPTYLSEANWCFKNQERNQSGRQLNIRNLGMHLSHCWPNKYLAFKSIKLFIATHFCCKANIGLLCYEFGSSCCQARGCAEWDALPQRLQKPSWPCRALFHEEQTFTCWAARQKGPGQGPWTQRPGVNLLFMGKSAICTWAESGLEV